MEDKFANVSEADMATISTEPPVLRLFVSNDSSGIVTDDSNDFYILEFNEENPLLMSSEIDQTSFLNDVSIPLNDDFQTFSKSNLRTVMLADGTQAFLAADSLNSEMLDLNDTELNFIQNQVLNEQVVGDDLVYEINGSSSESPPVSAEVEEELHGKKYACTYKGCERRYTTKHHLRVHERVHTGERPYVCKTCNRSFATSYSLKTHCRTHTGARPFECFFENCKKGFKTSGDLQKHVRTHTGERPFTCLIDGCDRSFTTSNIMKVHMRTHTGERPYACKYCDKRFSSTTNYRNHERIHTGLKPYACAVESCGKRFTEYSSLYKHQIVHEPSKQFKCNICNRVFKLAQTLQNHYLSAHSSNAKNEMDIVIIPQNKIEYSSDSLNVIENNLNSSMII
ncbi:zinc finger protein 76-like [Ctenocephalides felis]|uniref:zinc finger protein 76-like n=1 Tax=Ctenocephalides felis TaxID=7515 RepID=UPI000E6E2A5C|nr:zinc finger protein 76-like [Ctenocephalides felis]